MQGNERKNRGAALVEIINDRQSKNSNAPGNGSSARPGDLFRPISEISGNSRRNTWDPAGLPTPASGNPWDPRRSGN